MMDYRYNGKIETDIDKNVLTPIIVLCTRSGRKIGVINNIQSLKCSHPLNDVSEISFDVYKEVNGIKNIYWDFIKDFKFIFLPSVKDPRFRWYEITVNIDEGNDTIKHITGIHANEAELGQLMLYDVEINTENDIARDDYEIIMIGEKEYGTVFYNPEHPKASLLHRLLSDKASHYSIIHVDETLKNIQREFSFNGTSIADALRQTVAQEIGCLFVFGESQNNTNNNIFHRTISAYDLMDYCEDCGERGNYTHGVCTNCGSTRIKSGYGKDTGIFINAENLTDSISFTSNTDQVKNFFKMGAGDEYMEAAIRNCNPNGSNYLSYFSDEMKEDMSNELVTKLNQYESVYDSYLKDYNISLPSGDVNKYNILVNKYQDYIKEEIPTINDVVEGYIELTNYDYNAVNFKDYLQTIMMPASGEVVETTATEQIAKLTVESMSPIGTEDSTALSLTAANTAVESYAKVYVDTSRYKIEVSDSTYENSIWTGTITVTSLTDDEDTANKELTLIFNNDGAQFLKQKIQKMMEEHKVEDIGDVSFLQEDYTDAELQSVFKPKLKKYSLDALSLLDDLCTATMDILADANQGTADSQYYEDFYHPYWKKRKLIMEEETVREEEIRTVEQVIEDIDIIRTDIIETLDMHNFFGDELYSELMLYRRETEYSNPNFISDGLTDSEVIEKAQEYFKRAQEEIIKASTIQHSISCSLYNLFLIPEFRNILLSDNESQIQYIGEGLYIDSNGEVHNVSDSPIIISSVKRFIDLFDGGNWLRVRVDDKVYKLRLINWEIDYEKPEELEVEFSDVIYSGDTMSDITSLLSQARSMATSYNTIMRQAEKGNKANQTIEQTQKQGLMLSQNKIINDVDTQSFVLNSQGALMRAKNDFDDGYSPEQVKLLNKGIYYTNDDWETVKAGLGHFMYYDPETKTTREDYGIIASTIIGQLILGENLKIYSESGKFEMGDDGLVITSIDGEDNTDLFVVQKEKEDEQGRKYVEKYIYVDSDGNVKIAGNSVILGGKPLIEYIEETIEDGKDAYTIVLTNENHTFAGNTTSAIANEIECNVIAYKGATQVASTIGTITGQPTGMTTTILNNGTVNTAFRVSVTTSMITKNGVLNVPVTVDGKAFTKKFTYTLTLDGEKGDKGDTAQWYYGDSLTHTSGTATLPISQTADVTVGAMYLNTKTGICYKCTNISESNATWTYAGNITDGIQIGGRNLIIGTLNPDATGSGMKRPHIIGQITNTGGRGTCTVAEHGIRFTNTSQNWQYIYFGASSNSATPCMLGLETGETYTLSADLSWKILSSEDGMADTATQYMGAMLWYSTVESGSFSAIGTIDGFPITQADKGTEMSGRLEYTFTVPLTAKRLYLGIRSDDANANHYAVGDYIEARNLKLEKGNKATDWTPAPEDFEAELDTKADSANAVAEEQYIYIQAVSGTNSVNGTTTWITSTDESTVSDTTGLTPEWTTKRPTYRTNYPVLFVARQTKTVDGTVTCTTPIKDDTVTIIDGGHITTGTIDASVVSVTNINASNINTGTLDASRINTSSISVGDLSDGDDYGWSVLVNTTAIDYLNNTATLSATVYHNGTIQSSGFTLQWYKTVTSNGTTTMSELTGETSSTLSISSASQTGADTLEASYTCIVS